MKTIFLLFIVFFSGILSIDILGLDVSDLTHQQQQAFKHAELIIKSGNLEKFKKLLKKHNDINYKVSLFYIAIEQNQLPIIEYIIENKIESKSNIFADLDVGLYYAIEYSRKMIADYLIKKGAEINPTCKTNWCRTDFINGTYTGISVNEPIFKRFKKNKPCPKVGCISPLYFASSENNHMMISYLVKNGADIERRYLNGDTILHKVCFSRLLVYSKIHRCKADTLIYADLSTVSLLIDLGADINAVNNKGRTPLHIAVGECNLDLVKFLVSKGAKVDIKDIFGKTPIDYSAYEIEDWFDSRY